MSRPPECGLRVTVDAVGRAHFTFLPTAPGQAVRFGRFRGLVATGSILTTDPDAALLGATLAFGNVGDEISLRQLYAALSKPLRWREHIIVTWTGESHRHSVRTLSPLLTAAVAKASQPNYEVARDSLANWLLGSGLYTSLPHGVVLAQVIEDARTWLVAHLPGYLAANVLDIVPLADLPLTCLAREQQRLPLVPDLDPKVSVVGSRALLSLFSRETPIGASLDWPELRSSVTSAMARGDVAEYVARKRAIEEIGSLQRTRILSLDERLVVGFAVWLLSYGTPLSPRLALSTCLDYWGVSADLFLRIAAAAVNGVREEEALMILYAKCIEGAHPGVRHKVSAALRAFHAYLVDLLDLPELVGPVTRAVFDTPAPRANLIWPHEQTLVAAHLGQLAGESRLAAQAAAIHELAFASGRRIGDLLTLLIENLRPRADGSLVVAIDPLPTHERLKTPAARGVVTLDRQGGFPAVLQWLERRRSEGALPRDLAFGAPGGRGVWAESATRIVLLSAYKAVTGDASVTIHTARHTRLTFDLAEADATAEGERHSAKVAVDAGHVSASTSHAHYNHLAFLALGSVNDRLEREIHLSASQAGRWLGMSSSALRKRASRARLEVSSYGAERLDVNRRMYACPLVADQFSFSASPDFPSVDSARGLSFEAVFQVTEDLLADLPVNRVAKRADLAERMVLDAVSAACRIARPGTTPDVRGRSASMVLSMALQEVVGVASVVPARHPKLAQLHRWLSSARSDELVAGTESWRLLRRGAYVGLDRPHLAVGLLQLLKAADVSPSSIRVRFAHRSCDSNEDRRALEQGVRERIRGVLGADVIVECASERRGRPRAYLLVGSENAGRSSAALGLKGFHLLLFVASIYVELARSQESIQ